MKLMWILFGLVLAMWLVLGAALLVPAGDNVGGPHPTYKDVLRGGSGLARHGGLLWLGWAFGALQMLVFALLIVLGTCRPDKSAAGMAAVLLAGGVLYMALFTAIMLSYGWFLADRQLTLLGPFPTPTTLAVFGIWGVPFYFVVLYVVTFSRTFWTEGDEKKFQELLLAREPAAGSEK